MAVPAPHDHIQAPECVPAVDQHGIPVSEPNALKRENCSFKIVNAGLRSHLRWLSTALRESLWHCFRSPGFQLVWAFNVLWMSLSW
jgi:energy-converting hydrogenase Eha subunit F